MRGKLQIVIFAGFLVGTACLFRYLSGPFYFGNNSDPSYFYFYNFLYILEGKSLQFVDHPGAPLDILGALVVKIFFNPQTNIPWLLTNAHQVELVLGLVWFLMIVIYATTFVMLGFYALKKSQDRVFTGLVLLSSLWLIMVRSYAVQGILPISANVNSETMMMTADNLMLLAILRFYFSAKTESAAQAISLGAAVAFAIATKFTALPFFIVAWCILVTWQQRVLLGVVVTGGFVALTWPIWGAYGHMISWVKGLIIDRGMHGSGGEGFDGAGYLMNFFGWAIKDYWFFVAGWGLTAVIALRAKRLEAKIRRILLAVATGGLVQVLIVAKQPSCQYMAPMIGLSSLGLVFLYQAFPDLWGRGFKFVVAIILAVTIGLIAVSMWQVNAKTQKTKEMLGTIAKDYSQCWVCPFYRSSMAGFGLVFWNNVIHRSDYAAILRTYYPNMVYYDIFVKDFKDVSQQIVPLAQLKRQRSRVLIYGSDQDEKSFEPNLTVKKIYTNGGSEALYEVIAQHSNQATELFKYAVILYAQGHYEEALREAYMSQQLGLGQDISGFFELLRQKMQTPAPIGKKR